MPSRLSLRHVALPALLLVVASLLMIGISGASASTAYAAGLSANAAFAQAQAETGVPEALLKGLCYFEGRLSMHGGSPSMDHGYGCMHLIKNQHADTLDQAASLLHVGVSQLKSDLGTNIRGGAAVLKAEQLKLTGSLPTSLGGWYGEVANYSHVSQHATALSYADALYKVLNSGFNAQTDSGEVVTLGAQSVHPDVTTAKPVNNASTLPAGCSNTPTGDYPAAVNCLLDPNTFDCTLPQTLYPPCNYEERTDAGYPLPVKYVVIHDTEETLQGTLDTFQNPDPNTAPGALANYVVDTDGTVYQMTRDSNFTYNCGNYWYNQHSIGIEHIGFDATGFQWYNAAQYLGSAKLVAYLLTKYNLSLDRNDIVAHGTVPSPFSGNVNHVDPGPYWMWDYYFQLIHEQGIPFPHPDHLKNTFEIHTKKALGPGGTESPADFNFFYLYNGPSTQSGLIPNNSNGTDITDETSSIEPDMSYYYVAKVKDEAGTGDTMYEIWYGADDHVRDPNWPTDSLYYADGRLAWVAVPPGTRVTEGSEGDNTRLVMLNQSGSSTAQVFGKPATRTDGLYLIGSTPNGSIFVSTTSVIEDGTTSNLWYEINFTHRQEWVPASEVTVLSN